MAKHIQLIIGSVRNGRIAPQVADWIKETIAKQSDLGIELEVIDLEQENLPMFAEAMSPAMGPGDSQASKDWTEKIARGDGYIFVTPEYNRSYPGALKNAVDYISKEWAEKPVLLVSYGFIDGGAAASAKLYDLMEYLKSDISQHRPQIQLGRDSFSETGGLKAEVFAPMTEVLEAGLRDLVG